MFLCQYVRIGPGLLRLSLVSMQRKELRYARIDTASIPIAFWPLFRLRRLRPLLAYFVGITCVNKKAQLTRRERATAVHV